MDDLPAELLNLITEYCTLSSLNNLRLVGRRYRAASTPLLFENFHLGIFDESIDQLIALSKSKLAKYVKRCTVYLDILPLWDYVQWEHAVYMKGFSYWNAYGDGPDPYRQRIHVPDRNYPPCTLCNRPDMHSHDELLNHFSQERLHDAFREFKSIKMQQMQWLDSGVGVTLKECFAMLPNLDAVACTPTFTNRPQELQASWPLWNRMCQRLLLTPKDWGRISSQSSFLEDYTGHEFRYRVCFLVFEAMAFRASFSGTKPITRCELHVQQRVDVHRDPTQYETWESTLPLDRHLFNASFTRILEGFQHLTHINWCVGSTPLPNVERSVLTEETIVLLRSAKNLRSLCLSFYECGDTRQFQDGATPGDAAIDKLIDSELQWPQLHHMRLNFRASHGRLLALFKALSSSLRSVELIDMEVGNAQELIARMPEILQLEKIQLSSIWHTWESSGIQCLFPKGLDGPPPLEKGVRDYLLRRSDTCPGLGLC